MQLPQPDSEDAPKVGFGRIIRDEEGNVIDIIIDEEPEAMDEDEGDKRVPLNEEEPEREEVVAKTAVVRGECRMLRRRIWGFHCARTELTAELEKIAASAAPVQRHTSSAEKIWLARMVQKYGDDYSAASRDRKLNVWQKTPGEIKRMVSKAGGVQVLKAIEA